MSFRSRIKLFALLLLPLYSAPALAQMSYFNMDETANTNLKPFPKWTGVTSRYAGQQNIGDDQCGKVAFHPCAIPAWREFVASLRGKELKAQLDEVNDWGNEHPYIVDQLNWGLNDYWSTPYEFMEVNGDCEDYAIAKYYSLRLMGMPAERMRIIILQDLNLNGIIHAVLGVYGENGELWILDNQIKQVREAMNIYHYRPIYGVNERRWWRYNPRN